jgi:hypothetical protein
MKIDGQCHCGQLRYEAEIDPAAVTICHCFDCQKLSGSAFSLVVPARAESFKWLAGEACFYVKATADSGNARLQAFCPRCATRIYSGPAEGRTGYFGIRVPTISQWAELTPKEQIWCRSALAWVHDIGRIEPKSETE